MLKAQLLIIGLLGLCMFGSVVEAQRNGFLGGLLFGGLLGAAFRGPRYRGGFRGGFPAYPVPYLPVYTPYGFYG